jgi:hypothetical protein
MQHSRVAAIDPIRSDPIRNAPLRAPGCQREFDCKSPVNTMGLHPNQVEILSGQQNGSIMMWDLTANKCSDSRVCILYTLALKLSLSCAHGKSIDSRTNLRTVLIDPGWRSCSALCEYFQRCHTVGSCQQQGNMLFVAASWFRHLITRTYSAHRCTQDVSPQVLDQPQFTVCLHTILIVPSGSLAGSCLIRLTLLCVCVECWLRHRPTTQSKYGHAQMTLLHSRIPKH